MPNYSWLNCSSSHIIEYFFVVDQPIVCICKACDIYTYKCTFCELFEWLKSPCLCLNFDQYWLVIWYIRSFMHIQYIQTIETIIKFYLSIRKQSVPHIWIIWVMSSWALWFSIIGKCECGQSNLSVYAVRLQQIVTHISI